MASHPPEPEALRWCFLLVLGTLHWKVRRAEANQELLHSRAFSWIAAHGYHFKEALNHGQDDQRPDNYASCGTLFNFIDAGVSHRYQH